MLVRCWESVWVVKKLSSGKGPQNLDQVLSFLEEKNPHQTTGVSESIVGVSFQEFLNGFPVALITIMKPFAHGKIVLDTCPQPH